MLLEEEGEDQIAISIEDNALNHINHINEVAEKLKKNSLQQTDDIITIISLSDWDEVLGHHPIHILSESECQAAEPITEDLNAKLLSIATDGNAKIAIGNIVRGDYLEVVPIFVGTFPARNSIDNLCWNNLTGRAILRETKLPLIHFVDAIPVSHNKFSNLVDANIIESLSDDPEVIEFYRKRLFSSICMENMPLLYIMGPVAKCYFDKTVKEGEFELILTLKCGEKFYYLHFKGMSKVVCVIDTYDHCSYHLQANYNIEQVKKFQEGMMLLCVVKRCLDKMHKSSDYFSIANFVNLFSTSANEIEKESIQRIERHVNGCKQLTSVLYDDDQTKGASGWFDKIHRSFRLHDLSDDKVVLKLINFINELKNLKMLSLLDGPAGSSLSHHILLHTISKLQFIGFSTTEILSLLSGNGGSYAAQVEIIKTIGNMQDLGWSKVDIVSLLSGNGGSYAAQVEIIKTIGNMHDLSFSKVDIQNILSGHAGSGTGQAQLFISISIYRDQFHLKDCDIVLLLSGQMGGGKIQKFMQIKYKELVECGFSSQEIFLILGRGRGNGIKQNTLKIVKVLSNLAVLLATDKEKFRINGNPLTLVQIVFCINSACVDVHMLIEFCTCSSDDSCTTITKSSKDLLFYLLQNLSDDDERKIRKKVKI